MTRHRSSSGVDPQAIIGFVAHIRMGFGTGLHISADTAIPQQVYLRPQQVGDQFIGRQVIHFDIKALLHLGRNRNRLGSARKHTPARGDEFKVIVAPTGARQREQALALGKAAGCVGLGIDKYVHDG